MQTVADALALPVSTVKRWIRQGRIPIQRSGTHVYFSETALQKWATTHKLSFSLGNRAAVPRVTAPETLDSLASAMKRGKVFHGVAGMEAAAALRSAVDSIDYLTTDIQEELYEKLIERERLASTGIGNGIAIPHPRDPLSEPPEAPAITTCFLEKPITFNAIDDRPVFVFFLLISPTVKHHLHLLSRLSYCIRDAAFVAYLKTQPDASALYSRVAGFEKQLDAL
ncbi:MerR family transcriptional regulator [Desulfosarcina alkanivorans]|uniref:MerR family transcriptional regulator n=1 Tax=Desulfosarcina alkanivorans TaxID=571177 RepID=A0A5K7Z1P6_9BACT|nr:PTS sugar transporter subunit IIA [Desulfosarcina alkanivorans]BBO72414.1 MerR family transcriptional regulator [Desulfosarcina alkanivorans]